MTEYPKQPGAQGGWPAQPPRYSDSDGRYGYGQADYGQGREGGGAGGAGGAGYEQPGYGRASYAQPGYNQDDYGQVGYSDYGQHGQHGQRGQYGPGGARPARRRRRRGRGWIALLCTLIVLAVVFFIGDQVARGYAQNRIAQQLQSSSDMSTKPSVTIEGFPFLTQVASHDIRTIEISASNVPAGKIDIATVKATATGVRPNSNFSAASIDHISGTALITFDSLVNATGAQGVTISPNPAGGPDSATVGVGPLTATAQVMQTGPSQITVKMQSLGGIASSLIGSLPDYTFTVPKLPAGLQINGVRVTSQGVVIKVAAQNTTLSQ